MIDISIATFTWMLQCIAPHLDIKQSAFDAYMKQYTDWLINVRYRCTYHHPQNEGWGEYIWKNWVPDVPLISIGGPVDPLAPPERDPEHNHPTFDFGWGVGPVIDSYNKTYKANGTYPRQPGHESMEINGQWVPIRGIKGSRDFPPTRFETNEYIHPLVQFRYEVREARGQPGWDRWKYSSTEHPLSNWKREHKVGEDGRSRWWWHKEVEDDSSEPRWLPEWAILPHTSATEKNFERVWYEIAQDMGSRLSTTNQGDKEWLSILDRRIDFKLGAKAQNE